MEENKKYRFYGTILYYILKFLFSTLKVKVINNNNVDIDKAYIYAFWHNKLATPSIFLEILKKKLHFQVLQKMVN